MKIGDYVRFNNNEGELEETLWEVVGFSTGGGFDWVNIKHPTIGGVFTFLKDDVVEVICK